MMNLEVGKPYPLIAGRGEGVIFDIDDDGAKMFILLDRPTEREIAAVRSGQPFQLKLLEKDGILWILSKCGDMQWMDAPYNPRASIYTHLEQPESGQGLALRLVMADSRTAVVKHIRLIGLDEKFSHALIEAADRLRNTPMDWQETQRSISATMLRYQTKELVSMAAHSFRLRAGQ